MTGYVLPLPVEVDLCAANLMRMASVLEGVDPVTADTLCRARSAPILYVSGDWALSDDEHTDLLEVLRQAGDAPTAAPRDS